MPIAKVYENNNGKLIVAVSEGVKDKALVYIGVWFGSRKTKDSFGHAQLEVLLRFCKCVRKSWAAKRAIEFSSSKMCYTGLKTDVEKPLQPDRKPSSMRWKAIQITWWHMKEQKER